MEYSPLVNKMKLNLIDLIEEALQRRSLINSFSFIPAAIYIRLCCEYNSFYIYFLASALAPNSPYKPKGIERERMHGGRGWVNCIAAYIFLPQQPHPPPSPHRLPALRVGIKAVGEVCVCVCLCVGRGGGKRPWHCLPILIDLATSKLRPVSKTSSFPSYFQFFA